jgi:hypothetical protein
MRLKNPTTIGILSGILGLLIGGVSAGWYLLHQIEIIHRLHAASQAMYTLENLKLAKSNQGPLLIKFLEGHLDSNVAVLGMTYRRHDAYGSSERQLLLRIKAYREANPVTDHLSANTNTAATAILNQAAR